MQSTDDFRETWLFCTTILSKAIHITFVQSPENVQNLEEILISNVEFGWHDIPIQSYPCNKFLNLVGYTGTEVIMNMDHRNKLLNFSQFFFTEPQFTLRKVQFVKTGKSPQQNQACTYKWNSLHWVELVKMEGNKTGWSRAWSWITLQGTLDKGGRVCLRTEMWKQAQVCIILLWRKTFPHPGHNLLSAPDLVTHSEMTFTAGTWQKFTLPTPIDG